MRKYTQINVTPLSSAIGAEIGNVDISKDLSSTVITEIRERPIRAFSDLFPRSGSVEPERHKMFTKYFGDLFIHPNFNLGRNNPEMVYLTRKPGDTAAAGEMACGHYNDEKPPMGAILLLLKSLIGVAIPCCKPIYGVRKSFSGMKIINAFKGSP